MSKSRKGQLLMLMLYLVRVITKMQNKIELETISDRLYKYMCEEVVGSEKIVRYRRLYYKLHDDLSLDMYKHVGLEFISSGSKAEGLDLQGSDFDLMFLLKLWEVHEDKSQDKEILILDTDNALPGFALIKVPDNSSFPFSTTVTANGNLLANAEFNAINFCNQEKYFNIAETHGPCISDSFVIEFDILRCLKCHSWPTKANNWLGRFRPSGWPSQWIISKIISHGCLLVPVGSKSLGSEGHPFEWRFSFSLSEKLLVHSFNHTQLLCYALLKIWLKEILNRDIILKNILCSYFMKTVLFWIIEESENLTWIPKNLLHCFLLCIDRLHYWIICGYFPNYFIPEHNMIEGRLSFDHQKHLSSSLDHMNMRQNWKIMFSAPSLRNFRKVPIRIHRKPPRLSEFDETMLSLQTFGSLLLDILNNFKGGNLSAYIIYRIIHKPLPKCVRKMLILMFSKQNKNILATLDVVSNENKTSYFGYNVCLSRNLMNTFYSTEYGWLILAAFFYSTQNYYNMSCVLQLSWSIFNLKKCFVQSEVNILTFKDILKFKKMIYSVSFMKRIGYESLRVFHLDYNGLGYDNYPFLTDEIPREGTIGGHQSNSLLFFLQFLYARQRENAIETESAFQLLKTIVEEESGESTNIFCLTVSFNLLSKACELLNNADEYQTCNSNFLKAFKKSDKFEALVKYGQKDEDVKKMLELMQ